MNTFIEIKIVCRFRKVGIILAKYIKNKKQIDTKVEWVSAFKGDDEKYHLQVNWKHC